jgi:two-component system OmpR family response regulator
MKGELVVTLELHYSQNPRSRSLRILVVEDDRKTAAFMAKGLTEAGYVVDHAVDGREGLFMAAGGDYDAVVLDRMLPQLDGLGVVQALRAAGVQTPVIIVSALGQVDERVKGLRAGGDDYLTKPFAYSELQARIEALLRRRGDMQKQETRLACGDLEMDLLTRKVARAGQAIDLQPREFKLLEFMLRHSGQVVTRTMLLEGVWDYHFDPQTNVIDVHVSRLRGKIDKGFATPLLHTIRGAGYRLAAES